MIKKFCSPSLLFLVFSLSIFSACTKSSNKDSQNQPKEQIVHNAHLPPGWYSLQADKLNNEIDLYLTQAQMDFPVVGNNTQIKALIVPHAGHYYSGLCAACGYQTLLGPNGTPNDTFSKVIILCPSHRVFLNNIALPDYNVYQTCLGCIDIDTESIRKLGKTGPVFRPNFEAHNLEHAIEIQLPFLQKTLSYFKIIPLIVGNLTPESFRDALKGLKKIIDNNTLIVVSSDFTHFGTDYEFTPFSKFISPQIKYLDTIAIQSISLLSGYDFEQVLRETKATICGQIPINLLLGLIQMGLYPQVSARLACYYSSPQITKARIKDRIDSSRLLDFVNDNECQNSVSYASIIFTSQPLAELKPEARLTEYDKKSLLKFARQTIENNFNDNTSKLPEHLLYPTITSALLQNAGAFVTLNSKNGDLRGCIGQIITNKPLYQTIAEMAISSAFHDTRFSPLKKEELDNIVIDITILTAPQKVPSYKDIKIGTDGIILKKLNSSGQVTASAVFLPQVPSGFGWNLETTLGHLSQKAGIGQDGWKTNCEFEIFQGFEIKEK